MQQPALRPIPVSNKYELADDFEYTHNGETIVVPRYFCYDGASIPSYAWQLVHTPFSPLVMMPALLHDWLYYNHQIDRKRADALFYELLVETGVSRLRRVIIKFAVNWTGANYWENEEKHILEMVDLATRLQDSPNFERYHFPDEVLRRLSPSQL
ncbi:MAG: DUF1353 domain-containing protein [Deferribacteres bacterium]|nr:DUF1353 domain-containing protein [Deferribacteres bacterium]